MKVDEVQKSTASHNEIQMKHEPFFSKEGKASFFSKPNSETKPFFSPKTIQPKLTIGQPNDKYEAEADTMADKVVQRLSDSSSNNSNYIQAKCSDCEEQEQLQTKGENEVSSNGLQRKPIFESNIEQPEADVQTKPLDSLGNEPSPNFQSRLEASKGGGSSLSPETQNAMGGTFGADFSNVKVHTDRSAVQMNNDIGAQAFTHGSDIYFNQGEYDTNSNSGKHLLAHELTHTVQQGNSKKMVQRYESGEHAQLGETQKELTSHYAPTTYEVKKGDKLIDIAKKFGITVSELKTANLAKIKKWKASNGSGRLIEGFDEGELISVPQKLTSMAEGAIKDKSAKFTVNGVVLDYGVGIAMGDFFENPEQMSKADPKELKLLAKLINRERTGGKAVTTEEWEKATKGRYLNLAKNNDAHFAPPNKSFVPSTLAGKGAPNHLNQWKKYHFLAIGESQSGNKDKALMTNSFADHFLTDAFAAGHLINKRDIMEQFKGQLKLDKKGEEFLKDSKAFFDSISSSSFKGDVKKDFSTYETYEAYALGWNPNIDSKSRFSTLLQGIHKEEPDLLANAVAKGVHDKLNNFPGGLPVKNNLGDNWRLSGDGTLNADTKAIARKAVAQSQFNVISMNNLPGPLNHSALIKKVWDFTPKPDKAGEKALIKEIETGTDIKSKVLQDAIVKLINENYKLIIDELVKRKKLKKA